MMPTGKMRIRTQYGFITRLQDGRKQSEAGTKSCRFGLSILSKYGNTGLRRESGKAGTAGPEVPMVFREEQAFDPEMLIALLELFLRQGKSQGQKNGQGPAAKTILNQTILFQIRNQVQFLMAGSGYGSAVKETCGKLKNLSLLSDRGQVERAVEILRGELKKNGLRG